VTFPPRALREAQSAFLFQAEVEVFACALRNPGDVAHPLTLLPVVGQLAWLLTLFQTPHRIPTYLGIAGIGLLLGLMFVIGVIGPNLKVLASTVPFLAVAVLTVREHRRRGDTNTM
jgi:hypothetical protein